jgi:hypothetical protein
MQRETMKQCDQCKQELCIDDAWRFKDKLFCHQVCLIHNMADWGEEDIADYVACILLNQCENEDKPMGRLLKDFNDRLTVALRREFFELPDEE